MKKRCLLCYLITFLFTVCLLATFFDKNVALADAISSGGASPTRRPVEDGYLWAVIIFFVLDVVCAVFLIKNAITLIKLNGANKALGIFPNAIATLFTVRQIEVILAVEILILLFLYLTTRYLARKINRIKSLRK